MLSLAPVMLSPSPPVILSGAKNLGGLRVNSAKHLAIAKETLR